MATEESRTTVDGTREFRHRATVAPLWLFERRRGTTSLLTPEGADALEIIEAMLALSADLFGRAGPAQDKIVVRVSAGPFLQENYLRALVPRLHRELPDVGLIEAVEPETGARRWLDTSSDAVRQAYRETAERVQAERRAAFQRAGIDAVALDTMADWVEPMRRFFEARERARAKVRRRRRAR